MLENVVICEPVRTPVGRFGGQFKTLHAQDLGRTVLSGLLARCDGLAGKVSDVIFAQCYPTMDAPALGRVVALDSGLPVETGGYQLDRRCGSGLQAIVNAVMAIQAYVVANASRVREVEVNPLICTATCAIAADALIQTTEIS